MNRLTTAGLAMLAGVAIGAAAMNHLSAQASLPAYAFNEIEVKDAAGYTPIQTILRDENQKAGGKFLTLGGKVEVVEGATPLRITISQWKSMDDAKKFYSSPAVKKAFEDRKKFTAGARTFIVEGLAN
jgi:uncharacterized protein (DUF1330 family)